MPHRRIVKGVRGIKRAKRTPARTRARGKPFRTTPTIRRTMR